MPEDNFVGINAQMPFENDECSSQTPHFSLLTLTDTMGLSFSLSLSHTHKYYVSVSQPGGRLALLYHRNNGWPQRLLLLMPSPSCFK